MQKHESPSMALDYEERSIPLKGLGLWTLGLFVGIGAILAFVYYVYGTPKMAPDVEGVLNRPMNQPVLQSNGAADMSAFRAKQQEHLDSYGWVNRPAGRVRLPIQRAMDLVVQRGLPARGSK